MVESKRSTGDDRLIWRAVAVVATISGESGNTPALNKITAEMRKDREFTTVSEKCLGMIAKIATDVWRQTRTLGKRERKRAAEGERRRRKELEVAQKQSGRDKKRVAAEATLRISGIHEDSDGNADAFMERLRSDPVFAHMDDGQLKTFAERELTTWVKRLRRKRQQVAAGSALRRLSVDLGREPTLEELLEQIREDEGSDPIDEIIIRGVFSQRQSRPVGRKAKKIMETGTANEK